VETKELGGAAGGGGGGGGRKFDVETAIRVLRSAGYAEEALFLAKKHAREGDRPAAPLHDWYLRIQLEDVKDWHMALQYVFTAMCVLV
jgi:hypothetical protein